MTSPTIEGLEDRIGDTLKSVEGLTIEAGKVAEFAAAIGDDDPVFRDPETAQERELDRRPAPLTFTRTAMFPRYRPQGVGRLGFDLGFDIRYELHGEQVYEFERPVYIGDTLSGTTTLTDAYERQGREGGDMTFAVLETKYVDEDDAPVVTERETIIETSETVTETDRNLETAERDANSGGASVSQPSTGFEPIESVDDIAVGDGGPTVIVEDLAPQDFVQYAGASGDFNPVHYDWQYARALGNPDVFGQGMLTAGYAGHFVSDWFGPDAISRFRTRFTARVWPGDTLTVSGKVINIDAPMVTIELTVARQTGETVLHGDVTATVPPVDRK